MTTQSNKIYAAMSAAMLEVAQIGIAKDERNQGQKFNFRSIDSVYNVVTPILAKHGIVAMPEIDEVTREVFDVERVYWESGQQKRKVVRNTAISLKGSVRFYADDGSSIAAKVVAGSTDGGDKAETQAQSLFMKYGIIHGLMIPVKGMDDGDRQSVNTASEYHEPVEQSAQQQQPAQQQPAAQQQPIQQQQPAQQQPAQQQATTTVDAGAWNLDVAKGHLDSAMNIQELGANWTEIPKHLKPALEGYKNQLKARLNPQQQRASLNDEFQTTH